MIEKEILEESEKLFSDNKDSILKNKEQRERFFRFIIQLTQDKIIETFRKSFIKTLDLDDLTFPLSSERLREVIGIGYDDDGTVTVDWKDIDNIVKWTVKKANEKIAKKLEELESLKKEVKE